MTSGHTLRARITMAKFFILQAQAIAGFSSCGEAACYPEILRISYNFVQDNICIGQITWRIWLMLCKLLLNVLDKSYETTENDDKSFWGSQTIYNISTYWLGTPPKKKLSIKNKPCTLHLSCCGPSCAL